jgi:hypothetical protein
MQSHPVFLQPLYLKLNYSTSLYDKRDDFDFAIVNFPFLCSNIPLSPAYGVYISQLIRYARAWNDKNNEQYSIS